MANLMASDFLISEALDKLVIDAETLRSMSPMSSPKSSLPHIMRSTTSPPRARSPLAQDLRDSRSRAAAAAVKDAYGSSKSADSIANQLAEQVRRAVHGIEQKQAVSAQQLVLAVTQLQQKSSETHVVHRQLTELQTRLDATDAECARVTEEKEQQQQAHATELRRRDAEWEEKLNCLKQQLSDEGERTGAAQLHGKREVSKSQAEVSELKKHVATLTQQLKDASAAREDGYQGARRDRARLEQQVQRLEQELNAAQLAREAEAKEVKTVLAQYHTALTRLLPGGSAEGAGLGWSPVTSLLGGADSAVSIHAANVIALQTAQLDLPRATSPRARAASPSRPLSPGSPPLLHTAQLGGPISQLTSPVRLTQQVTTPIGRLAQPVAHTPGRLEQMLQAQQPKGRFSSPPRSPPRSPGNRAVSPVQDVLAMLRTGEEHLSRSNRSLSSAEKFSRYDMNKDGTIDKAEWQRASRTEKRSSLKEELSRVKEYLAQSTIKS